MPVAHDKSNRRQPAHQRGNGLEPGQRQSRHSEAHREESRHARGRARPVSAKPARPLRPESCSTATPEAVIEPDLPEDLFRRPRPGGQRAPDLDGLANGQRAGEAAALQHHPGARADRGAVANRVPAVGRCNPQAPRSWWSRLLRWRQAGANSSPRQICSDTPRTASTGRSGGAQGLPRSHQSTMRIAWLTRAHARCRGRVGAAICHNVARETIDRDQTSD